MPKISGLDQLSKQLKQAEEAMAGVDGHLGSFTFDPFDPESLEIAIQKAQALVEDRLGSYAGNPIVEGYAEQLKEHLRDQILERAAKARLEGNT